MSDTSASGIDALAGVLIGLTTVTVLLRFYARKKQNAPLLADDWLMLVSLTTFIAAAAIVFVMVKDKLLGHSSFSLPPEFVVETFAKSTKLQLSIDFTTIMSLGCTKASALFFYKRIFCVLGPKTRVFNWIVIASIGVVAAWVIAFEFLAGFQCKGHTSALDDPVVYKEYCVYSWSFFYGLSISDVLLDVWILLLPIPNILRLHTTTAKKLSIVGIFFLAFIALGSSIARMVIFIQVEVIGLTKFQHLDAQHFTTRIIFFYILEAGVSIIAINLPSLWPVFFKLGPEAMLKMVRSVTSLASRDSSKNASKASKVHGSHDGRMRSDASDPSEHYQLSDYKASSGRGHGSEEV